MFTGGRKMRVNVSPNVDLEELRPGQEVVLNEALNVVIAQSYETVGEVVMLKEVLADSQRALVISQADEERARRPAFAQKERALGKDAILAVVAVDRTRRDGDTVENIRRCLNGQATG